MLNSSSPKGTEESSSEAVRNASPSRFGRRYWSLFLLGLVGVATLPFVLTPLLREQPLPPGVPRLPLPLLVALSMGNPVLLLAGAVALGVWLAPKVGLVSLTTTRVMTSAPIWPSLRRQAPLALAAGFLLAPLIALLDLAFQPHLGPAWADAVTNAEEPETLGTLVSALLYGGITEELIVRWGFLPLFAWAGWRLLQRRRREPGAVVMWSAILLSAVLFGLGHLPVVSALVPLTPVVVLRTVVLNAVGGLLFGWLFWRRSLEAAMLAHASAHLGFAVLARIGLA